MDCRLIACTKRWMKIWLGLKCSSVKWKLTIAKIKCTPRINCKKSTVKLNKIITYNRKKWHILKIIQLNLKNKWKFYKAMSKIWWISRFKKLRKKFKSDWLNSFSKCFKICRRNRLIIKCKSWKCTVRSKLMNMNSKII